MQITDSDRKCSKCGKPTPERELLTYENKCEDCAIGILNTSHGQQQLTRVMTVKPPVE